MEVVIYDNFSTGRREFVPAGAELVEADVLDRDALAAATAGCDTVFHLQANADVRHGLEHPQRDLRENTIATASASRSSTSPSTSCAPAGTNSRRPVEKLS